jgi:hypothetical protein
VAVPSSVHREQLSTAIACQIATRPEPRLIAPIEPQLAIGVRSSQGDSMRSASLLLLGQNACCPFFRCAPRRSALGWVC